VAVALLLPVLVSGLLPPTVTVFVCSPIALGLVTRVLVTDSPAAMSPIVQLRIAPPVQLPFVIVADTNVLPPGIGSDTTTPVSALGPLLVTTIVQVIRLPSFSSWLGGGTLFVTVRSTRAWTQVDALDSSEPSLLVVTLPVLLTTPVSGQSPPGAPVVAEEMCTVNIEAAWVVPAGTVTGPQERTPAVIAQVLFQPAPWES